MAEVKTPGEEDEGKDSLLEEMKDEIAALEAQNVSGIEGNTSKQYE